MPAPSVQGHLWVTKSGNVTIVRFGGFGILDDIAIGLIGAELYGMAERPDCLNLLLDFAGVELLSSWMLGKTIVCSKGRWRPKGESSSCATLAL